MRYVCVFLLWLPLALAQTSAAVGEKIFAQTCATGYCHGSKGTPGGAPRLVGRGFNQGYISATVARGISGTAMPAFAATLSPADLAAVVAYVAGLNGIAPASGTASAARRLSAEAIRGRALFSEATRSFGRCSTCHEEDGIGIPVATPIALVPPTATALRTIATPRVRTAAVDGEAMPALVISEGKRRTILYDLTSSPPVQRSLDPAAVKLTDGSQWTHAAAITSYSDAELTSILTWLREMLRQ
jgi:mono/diheme cytochrome c family protein